MDNLWLPYFSLTDITKPLKVKSALGAKILLEDGTTLIDAISSWWAMCHGYQHSFIIDRIKTQISNLSHIMLGGLIHQPALDFSTKLIKFLEAKELSRVFFSDSGSTAVEVAIKMAIQFFYEIGNVEKKNIMYFENGYHGETLGALSVSHSMGSAFPAISNKILVKIPHTEKEFEEFEQILKQQSHTIAGAIIEPILQGAGGMILHRSEDIKRLWKLLNQYNILIIADECATGFYRLGTKFAFLKIGIEPDILILGKALTGGYIPFAATIAKEFIFQEISGKSRFLHGPTFAGNPVACSAGIANIDLFEMQNYNISKIQSFFKQEFKGKNARIMGAMCAFDITKEAVLQIKHDVANGKTKVFLRPFGNILYAMPPFVINDEELKMITNEIQNYI